MRSNRSECQVGALCRDTLAEIDEIPATANRHLGDTLARADAALATLDAARQDLKPVLAQSAATPAQVNDASFLDCDRNPDCLFNRCAGASKGIERAALNFGQASADVRSAVPRMLSPWDQIRRRHRTAANLINAGDAAGAAAELLDINKANGQVLAGLTRRREAERELFLG